MEQPLLVEAAAAEDAHGRRRFEVGDVVRQYGARFVRTHQPCADQRRVLQAIRLCRTAALGGHVEGCDGCGHQRIAYNSCRNRHCPKCQGAARARWMASEQATLLPVEYFHVVFTPPHALNDLIRVNRRELYGQLFRSAAETLLTLARDGKYLGGEPAITMVLHTWGQNLCEHVHVHCVVSGGGLSADGHRWQRLRRRGFLFPVRVLSKLFRGKYLAALDTMRTRQSLRFAGRSASLTDVLAWATLRRELAGTPWVVYAKPPFGGPERVLKYLSRYTHRVAISNHRILFVGDGVVRFQWKDYAAHSACKQMTLEAGEFLRRFLLHVVPRGFMRIRHYGLLANGVRRDKLARSRALLGEAPATKTDLTDAAPPDADSAERPVAEPRPLGTCPVCGGRLRIIETLPRPRIDSS